MEVTKSPSLSSTQIIHSERQVRSKEGLVIEKEYDAKIMFEGKPTNLGRYKILSLVGHSPSSVQAQLVHPNSKDNRVDELDLYLPYFGIMPYRIGGSFGWNKEKWLEPVE